MAKNNSGASFIDDFNKDIPRGVVSRRLNQQFIPQARWQSTETILNSAALEYDPQNPGSKILIGAIGDKLIGIDDPRHILTIGGSRGGKSVGLTANALFYPGSILATDPKGEIANITAQRRADLGQKVLILDPFEIVADRLATMRCSYNFLSILQIDSPTIIEDAELIADGIIIVSQHDPHWDESSKNFIGGVCLHVASAPQYEGRRNLVTVREVINTALATVEEEVDEDESRYILEEEMLENAELLRSSSDTEDLGAAISGAAHDFFDKSYRERDSVLSTARRHTKFLDYSGIRSVSQDHDFDLADLKREQITIYLCIPASRMSACRSWLRLFINQLLAAMEQERRTPDVPVLVCLDEMPVLQRLREVESAAGQIASFGCRLWFVIQDWGQAVSLYKDRAESLLANAGIWQAFANSDLATTEYLSKRLGKTPVTTATSGEIAADQRAKGLTGTSESTSLYDLLTPEEITRLFSRNDRLKRQLVIWSGYHPMILSRVEYFDETNPLHRHFKDKFQAAQ